MLFYNVLFLTKYLWATTDIFSCYCDLWKIHIYVFVSLLLEVDLCMCKRRQSFENWEEFCRQSFDRKKTSHAVFLLVYLCYAERHVPNAHDVGEVEYRSSTSDHTWPLSCQSPLLYWDVEDVIFNTGSVFDHYFVMWSFYDRFIIMVEVFWNSRWVHPQGRPTKGQARTRSSRSQEESKQKTPSKF